MAEDEPIRATTSPIYPRVIVPLDGSHRAEAALAPALELARRWRVPITLLRWEADHADVLDAEIYLHRLAAVHAGGIRADVAVRTAWDGPVAKCLVTEADRDGGLTCLASHGRSGVGGALLGSVAERVLRLSNQPVLVVGPNVEPETSIGDKRLVVCVDGSRFAELVIPLATDWAERLGMPVWLVEAVDPGVDAQIARLEAGDLHETSYVTRVASALPVDVNWEVLHDRHPADAIVGLTERWPVGLLAVATHGRSGWSRLTLGSVAMQIVHRASCPVLLVRPPSDAVAELGTVR